MNPWTSHPHDCTVVDAAFADMLDIARYWLAERQAAELAAKP